MYFEVANRSTLVFSSTPKHFQTSEGRRIWMFIYCDLWWKSLARSTVRDSRLNFYTYVMHLPKLNLCEYQNIVSQSK